MSTRRFVTHYFPPLLLGTILFTIYLATLAPGVTWAHDGADGGDLITAAATGGVAHPTGYPTYLLLARLFQSIPIGSLAYRTNLLSAVASVLAAVILYFLVLRYLGGNPSGVRQIAALTAGIAFGVSPLVWTQSVITEVYALQSLLMISALYIATSEPSPATDRRCGLILGLAMGNHITTVLLAAILLPAGIGHRVRTARDWQSFARRSVFFLIGLLVYLVLPWWAGHIPPVNWGNPITVNGFWWLVSGQLYADSLLPIRLVDVWLHVQAWASLLTEQWGPIGLIMALLGLVYFYSPSPLYRFTLWQAILYSGFAILYRSVDSYVYLLPVCVSLSIWMGIGLAKAVSLVHAMKPASVISSLFLLYLLGSAAGHWGQVDASADMRAESFGRQVLSSAPRDSLVFATGDKAVFTMWYFHFALQERPDLAILAPDLLPFDWYRKTVRARYPALHIDEASLFAEVIEHDNPEHAACYVEYLESPRIECR